MAEKRSLRLRVPVDQVDLFKEFAALPDDSAGAILEVLKRDPPILGLSQLAEFIAAAAPDISERTDELVGALAAVAILQTSHEWTIDQVAEGIAAAENLALDDTDRIQLGDRLRAALGAKTLLVNAKAADLASAHERQFHIARIVTEARPVYGHETASAPAAAVITHFLELAYFTPGGSEVESIFVGLDEANLAMLNRQVERAQEKAISLRQFLNEQGLFVFDLSAEGDDA